MVKNPNIVRSNSQNGVIDPAILEKITNVVPHAFKNEKMLDRGVHQPLQKLPELDCYYSGEWKGNMLHGIGLLVLHDGSTYHGSFFNSVADG